MICDFYLIFLIYLFNLLFESEIENQISKFQSILWLETVYTEGTYLSDPILEKT